MSDSDCVDFLQWALPRMRMRWPGFRRVRNQVRKRIRRRLKELGLEDIRVYRSYIEAHPAEWSNLDGLCRISISRFYRDRGVFDYLKDVVLPQLADAAVARGNHLVRCWSAGCASGEEIYTLKAIWKMCAVRHTPDVVFHIVATDADPNMLARAQRGCYAIGSLKDFPTGWLAQTMTRSGELLEVRPELREQVEFRLQDIREGLPEGSFQLILCRHLVFTYFDGDLQRELLQEMVSKLEPGGILVTSKQEPLPMLPVELEACKPPMGVYRHMSSVQ